MYNSGINKFYQVIYHIAIGITKKICSMTQTYYVEWQIKGLENLLRSK